MLILMINNMAKELQQAYQLRLASFLNPSHLAKISDIGVPVSNSPFNEVGVIFF
jgi:hypothetical protein